MSIKRRLLVGIEHLFDVWLGRMTPSERSYVLVKLGDALRARLTQHEKDAKLAELRVLADELKISSFTVLGDLGPFEGSVHDKVIIGEYTSRKTYSASFQAFLRDDVFASGSGTYIDVGANIGLTIIPLARARPGVSYYAFEPEPNNFLLLRKNLLANEVVDRVRAFNVAAFSDDGVLQFELSGHNMGDHRVRTERAAKQISAFGEENRQTTVVRAGELDKIIDLQTATQPLMVKIDTQGSEVHVFRGASKLLNCADYLYVEFGPYWIRRIGDSTDEFLEMLQSFGFRSACIDDEASPRIGFPALWPLDSVISELQEFAANAKPYDYTNVLACRKMAAQRPSMPVPDGTSKPTLEQGE